MRETTGLPIFSRLVFYGMCGFFIEVVFTGVWYIVDPKYNYGWILHATTSLWSFPIYSVSIYVFEKLYIMFRKRLYLPFRILMYVLWIYTWEYSSGQVLRYFNACPWNYAEYTNYHLHGLITLDYFFIWCIAGISAEKLVIDTALSLEYVSKSETKKFN